MFPSNSIIHVNRVSLFVALSIKRPSMRVMDSSILLLLSKSELTSEVFWVRQLENELFTFRMDSICILSDAHIDSCMRLSYVLTREISDSMVEA